MEAACPLCQHPNSSLFHRDRRRSYWQCQNCQLVFVDPDQRLTPDREKAEYDLHQNDSTDPAYRQFLLRLSLPMINKLSPGATGLDYGCGPGPTLSVMFEEAGFAVNLYDSFYYPNQSVLQQQYHFISATEVAEHLYEPGKVLSQLWQQLLPGGTLGLMTKLMRNREAFSRWHYINDPTHVCFFCQQSLNWLAEHLQAKLTVIGNDVILLEKPSHQN